MDLNHADQERKMLGVIDRYELELAFGKDEIIVAARAIICI